MFDFWRKRPKDLEIVLMSLTSAISGGSWVLPSVTSSMGHSLFLRERTWWYLLVHHILKKKTRCTINKQQLFFFWKKELASNHFETLFMRIGTATLTYPPKMSMFVFHPNLVFNEDEEVWLKNINDNFFQICIPK